MSKKYVICTDTCCDLSPEERKEIGIWPQLFDLNVDVDRESVDITNADEFYSHLEDRSYAPGHLKTASGSPGAFEDLINDIMANTDPETVIVYAGVSHYMSSSTAQIGRMVMKEFAEDYPERQFIYLDTKCVSNGLATYLQYLARYDGDDIEAYSEELGKHIVHLFAQTNFDYSLGSGRFNAAKEIAARVISATGVTYLGMHFPSDDKLTTTWRVYLGPLLVKSWVKYYQEHVAPDNEFIRIGYGGKKALERAERLIKAFEKIGVPREKIQLTHVSPIIGAHTGETVISFFFKQKDERPEH